MVSIVTTAIAFLAFWVMDLEGFFLPPSCLPSRRPLLRASSYFEDFNNALKYEKRVTVGFTTDAWNIGQKKMKDLLSVYKMTKRVMKSSVATVELPMWEVNQGPHYEDLQHLLESFWIPDFASTEHLLLQYDLIVIPDPILAKYLIEAFFEKESKVKQRKAYYEKLMKQSWGVIELYPPRQRMEWERIKSLSKQRWNRKFPPIAVLGMDTYRRMTKHSQVEYFAHGLEDFALHLPWNLVPSRRVLVLRFRNRFEALVQSLVMKGINVTSAYPVSWLRREWNSHEERSAKEVDVVYFHQSHAVNEWVERLGHRREKEVVAACHDLEVAQLAKQMGFRDVFYAKQGSAKNLMKTVSQAVDHAKSLNVRK